MGGKAPFSKICHINPRMMKLGKVKKIKKYTKHVAHSLSSADRKLANFAVSRNTNIDCILKQTSFNFFRTLKDCSNKHGYNFYDVSKTG